MARTLAEKIKQLPAARRRKAEARVAELMAEEMFLRDLRKAMNRTQVEVAKVLKVARTPFPAMNNAATCCFPPCRAMCRPWAENWTWLSLSPIESRRS